MDHQSNATEIWLPWPRLQKITDRPSDEQTDETAHATCLVGNNFNMYPILLYHFFM